MKVVYIGNRFESLTKGKIYTVLDHRILSTSIIYDHEYLLENDLGNKEWFSYYSGIIIFAELYDKYVKFIDSDITGLTNGAIYQLCGRSDDYQYYFLDDNLKYVGYGKSSRLFSEFDRNKTIDLLLKGT